ncbi:hypothetical protein U27_03465 [Candidatus Vecturithrix granuli]|uniref:Uncharacterized protein n=1 Tax=Vecturithrix granuli TaxID=1499967 RepID=A0A081BVZ8_VECG1|nr:hypothetical protein U27_03465 [Candidatus Vecturithrix granuli]
MKISIKSVLSVLILVIMMAVFSGNCLAQKATDAMFADGSLEYHFLLNDAVNVSETYMPTLPAQIIEQLAPMFLVKAEGSHDVGMYVDTPDRLLQQQNLILRVKEGKITLKARGATPDSVLDLEKCDKKKYEIDYSGQADYSISSDLKFKDDEFDITFTAITPQKLYAFIQSRCPTMYTYLTPIVNDARVRIPGVASQYEFEASLSPDHPAVKKAEITLTIWFMAPKDETIVELAYSGAASDKDALDALQSETIEFLKSKGLLHAEQQSKTELYFDTFLE